MAARVSHLALPSTPTPGLFPLPAPLSFPVGYQLLRVRFMGRERIFAAELKRKRRTNGSFYAEMISFRHAIRGGAMIIYELPFPGVLMMN